MDGTTERPKIKSIDRVFLLLEELQAREGAGVTELADHFDLSKSTIHDYLRTLKRRGYVEQRNGKYELTVRFLKLGGYARSHSPAISNLYEISKPELDELALEIGENVQLIVEQDGVGLLVYQTSGNKAVRTDVYTGMDIPLYCTALGKALLAHLPRDRMRSIIETTDLESKTDTTITDRGKLIQELETVRDRGMAFDNGERFRGMRCVGIPIQGNDDQVLGSVSISGPTRRMKGEYFDEEIPKILQETIRIIEIRKQNR